MKTVQRIFWAHLVGAAAALAAGFWLVGRPEFGMLVAFLALVWFLAQRRWAGGVENMMLFLFSGTAALGLYWGVLPPLMLLAVVLSLGAWDLDHFTQRLSRVEKVEFNTGLGRSHLARLVKVEAVGLAAGLLPLLARLRIDFWWAVLLAFLAVIGISRIVAFVRRETEGPEPDPGQEQV